MSKFKIKLKITGFELEIEGSRDEVPLIANSVGQQIAGLLEPASIIIEGNSQRTDEAKAVSTILPKPPRKSQHRTKPKKDDESNHEQVLDWTHDPSKWGTPQLSWNTARKSIWLLFVISQEIGINGASGICITNTFNKHFKQAKAVLLGNVNRDLGRLKTKVKPVVAEDTTNDPTKWYLTQEGVKMAQELVQESRGIVNGSN